MADKREAKGLAYWSSQPATNDGVLGGYGRLNRVDALASRLFILKALPAVRDRQADPTTLFRACDTGAGVGRVTLNTLLPSVLSLSPPRLCSYLPCSLFDRIDLVENVDKFVQQARVSVASATEAPEAKKRPTGVRFWTQSLQDFDPVAVSRSSAGDVVGARSGWGTDEGYDLIWNQW